MGANEDHLKKILNDDPFRITELTALKNSLDDLETSLNSLTEPGWEGTSAEKAVELFTSLAGSFSEVSGFVTQIENVIKTANKKRVDAENRMATLPPAEVDSFWKDLVAQGEPVKFQLWQLPAESALNFIEDHMAAEREKEAGLILDDLRSDLSDQTTELRTIRYKTDIEHFEIIDPEPVDTSGDIPTYAPQYPGGRAGGKPYTPPETEGKVWEQPPRPPKEPPVVIEEPPRPPRFPDPPIDIECWFPPPNIDDDGTGTVPPPVTGTPGVPGVTPGGGGGGMIPGLLGGGAGAAAIGVGARLAGSGMGGMGGGLGAGGRGMSSGGLLGGGGAGGAGGAGGTGAGARGGAGAGGAGGRGSSGMMGGGGGGSASDKEKRSGLGGIIAPRLDDEDDVSPRSAGAGAGGRDQPSE